MVGDQPAKGSLLLGRQRASRRASVPPRPQGSPSSCSPPSDPGVDGLAADAEQEGDFRDRAPLLKSGHGFETDGFQGLRGQRAKVRMRHAPKLTYSVPCLKYVVLRSTNFSARFEIAGE